MDTFKIDTVTVKNWCVSRMTNLAEYTDTVPYELAINQLEG